MSKTPSQTSGNNVSPPEVTNEEHTPNASNSRVSVSRLAVPSGTRIFPDIFSRVRLRTDEDVSISVNNSKQEVNLPGYIPPTSNENENEPQTAITTVVSKASTIGRCGSAPPYFYQARDATSHNASIKSSAAISSTLRSFETPSKRPSLTASIVQSNDKVVSQRPSQRSAVSEKASDDIKNSADAAVITDRPSDTPTVLANEEQRCEQITDSVMRTQPVEINAARRLLDQQQPAVTVSGKAARASLSLVSVGSCVCRICHTSSGRESLVSPCHCKGSLAYVHRACLERWLTQAGLGHCEVCLYQYNVEMTRRYGFLQALRLWVRLPRNRGLLQSDLLICTLFTVVTLGLITVFLVGARLFVLGGLKLGISRVWTHGAISFSLSILIVAYVINLYLIAKGQLGPWWAWWRSNVNVRLVLDDEIVSHVITDQNRTRETRV